MRVQERRAGSRTMRSTLIWENPVHGVLPSSIFGCPGHDEEPSVRAGEPFTTEIESERMPEEFRQVPGDRSAPNPSVDGFDYREPPTIMGDPEGSGRGDPGAPGVNPKNRAKRRRRSRAYHCCRARSLVRRLLVASIVVNSAVDAAASAEGRAKPASARLSAVNKVQEAVGAALPPRDPIAPVTASHPTLFLGGTGGQQIR